jgi:hypothetical protein
VGKDAENFRDYAVSINAMRRLRRPPRWTCCFFVNTMRQFRSTL